MPKVTESMATKALRAVEEWAATQGYGSEIEQGYGPTLNMEWDWPGTPTPTIIWEGGPYDWALLTEGVDTDKVWSEPYSGWALCLYRR